MQGFLFDGPVEPIHQFPHPSRSFKRRRGLEHHSKAFAVWPKSLHIIGDLLVLPTMILILSAVFQENTVQLLDVVLGRRDRFKAAEDHVHRIGIASHFLLVAAGERFASQAGKEPFNLGIAQSRAFNARRRPHTLNGGDPSKARQLFRGECLDNSPATLELVDLGDELEDFRSDGDVLDFVHI